MIVSGLDLNYLGVYDVWNNDLGKRFIIVTLALLPNVDAVSVCRCQF